MHVALLLLGVTGDLASRKIIPSLAAFSKNPAHTVQLVGVSRSKPDEAALARLIEKEGGRVSTAYVQGSYTHGATLQAALDKAASADIVILYLAVPPHLFVDILQVTCTLNSPNIHIVIEKPFGQNLTEAKTLLAAAKNCPLTPHVHFFDHYLFKAGTYLTKSERQSLDHLKGVEPVELSVRALENLGVGNRIAYYDRVGATKDMWQHLYSFLQMYAKTFAFELSWDAFEALAYRRAQYTGYLAEVGHDSTTETYFFARAKCKDLKISFETGKRVGFKENSIRATYADNTVVEWHTDPSSYLRVSSGDRDLHYFQLPKTVVSEHVRLFESVVAKEADRFVSARDIYRSWQTYAKIIALSDRVETYPQGTLPAPKNKE